jgi:hypothetical protein
MRLAHREAYLPASLSLPRHTRMPLPHSMQRKVTQTTTNDSRISFLYIMFSQSLTPISIFISIHTISNIYFDCSRLLFSVLSSRRTGTFGCPFGHVSHIGIPTTLTASLLS